MLAPEIVANSIDQFFSRQLSIWLYNCSLDTRSPRELASSIWQRRTEKALRKRRPPSSCFRSSVVNDRTNIGGFMPAMISHNCPYTKSFMYLQ
jgi:hypothetical protein